MSTMICISDFSRTFVHRYADSLIHLYELRRKGGDRHYEKAFT